MSDTGKATLSDVGNPRIEIYNYPPSPKAQRPIIQERPQPKPNILFKNVRPAWIWYDEHEGFFDEVQNRQYATARGVIARFKNESAEREATEARFIRAELVLRDVNEQEMEQGVHSACWLRERTDTVDFIVGEDHWIFLGSVDPADEKRWIVPWKQQKKSWQGDWYELEGHRVSGLRSIEIRLIGESNKWLIKPVVIDVVVNAGEPTVAVRPPA